MARPREFDENQALDAALEAFWARGYDATSIEDLVTATGVGRASLYAAFGDKEHLFRRVLDRYLARDMKQIADATRELSGEAAIRAFFAQRVAKFCPKDGARGCFLQASGTSGSSVDMVESAGLSFSREMRAWLVDQLKQAQAAGQVARGTDLAAVADLLLVLHNGLSASARAGLSPKALRAAADEGLARIFAR
ncbi:MAG TPA: TetR/AcrR family transcriptional regulator [Polyangia bacterium]|nr:TetR/AcrR family transcriptional regulator [Polyangia bacterium]